MTATRPAKPWRVYGSQPPARTVATERQARRLARRYARLGIRADLYVADGAGGWRSADGSKAHLDDAAPAASEANNAAYLRMMAGPHLGPDEKRPAESNWSAGQHDDWRHR